MTEYRLIRSFKNQLNFMLYKHCTMSDDTDSRLYLDVVTSLARNVLYWYTQN
jgi:hypothetical protein